MFDGSTSSNRSIHIDRKEGGPLQSLRRSVLGRTISNWWDPNDDETTNVTSIPLVSSSNGLQPNSDGLPRKQCGTVWGLSDPTPRPPRVLLLTPLLMTKALPLIAVIPCDQVASPIAHSARPQGQIPKTRILIHDMMQWDVKHIPFITQPVNQVSAP